MYGWKLDVAWHMTIYKAVLIVTDLEKYTSYEDAVKSYVELQNKTEIVLPS